MRRHPEIGAEIVRPVPAFNVSGGVADIILSHHERYDGMGYPAGMARESIPLGARIVAVADTLSALLRDRPYRSGCTFEEAVAEIRRCSGTQFDPTVVEGLERMRGEVRNMLLTPTTALLSKIPERIADVLGAVDAWPLQNIGRGACETGP